jgi:hypothetical protein
MKFTRGATRYVFLTKNYAIKIPYLGEWRLFLCGLLANMQERQISKAGYYEGICPILFSFPGGFLVVMPKLVELTDTEYYEFDYEELVEKPEYRIPAENKSNSFGWLDAKPVAIDYGS